MIIRNFKKYPNRRIYCEVESRYVRLRDVAATIIEGHSVRIATAQGADITRAVLLETLAHIERDREAARERPVLSVETLHSLLSNSIAKAGRRRGGGKVQTRTHRLVQARRASTHRRSSRP